MAGRHGDIDAIDVGDDTDGKEKGKNQPTRTGRIGWLLVDWVDGVDQVRKEENGRLFIEEAAATPLFSPSLFCNNFQQLHFEDERRSWLDDRGGTTISIGQV